jgi:hypothetical protein
VLIDSGADVQFRAKRSLWGRAAFWPFSTFSPLTLLPLRMGADVSQPNARSASKSIRRIVLGKPIIRGTSRYRARARSRASIRQLVEQRLGVLQIERVEAFGEPAIDRSEQFANLLRLPLIAPEPRHTHRRAQLQGFCLLLRCNGVVELAECCIVARQIR